MFQLALLCLKRHDFFFFKHVHTLIQLNANKSRASVSKRSGQPTYLESQAFFFTQGSHGNTVRREICERMFSFCLFKSLFKHTLH